MADKRLHEAPDVEDILASIREIIAEDGAPGETRKAKPKTPEKPAVKKARAKSAPETPAKKAVKKPETANKIKKAKRPAPKKAEKSVEDDVLLLTEVAPPAEVEKPSKGAETRVEDLKADILKEIGEEDLETSADIDAALEDLVRAMMKEMLKEYLDKHLAEVVKKVAAQELEKLKEKP